MRAADYPITASERLAARLARGVHYAVLCSWMQETKPNCDALGLSQGVDSTMGTHCVTDHSSAVASATLCNEGAK
jgi:hypothetical protein